MPRITLSVAPKDVFCMFRGGGQGTRFSFSKQADIVVMITPVMRLDR